MTDKGNNGDKDKKVTIVVHNEDSGRNIQVKGLESDPVQFYIDRLYEELKITRKPDDRLRCESTGADVFPFASLTIEEYLRQHCSAHEWLFAGGTGGA
jgi:hypothetical protein